MPLSRERIVPFVVAVALFMENMDSTVIATALPAIAADIGTSPIELKLAITSYLLALAIFIPTSGWMADRFGARTIFRSAIVVFVAGSLACAVSQELWHFVLARFLQGIGGAMMSPVGRLVLIRAVDRSRLVDAMALVTLPALIGPLLGPPLGGFITTFASWHWIFIINVPIGVVGFLMVTAFVENVRSEVPEPFDVPGMALVALGIGGLAFGSTVSTVAFVPAWVAAALLALGAAATATYVVYARRVANPVMDLSLFALPTFRAGVAGGFVFRVGAGALPFLLPLMLQVGFGMTPFESGMVTFATAFGAMVMKTLVPRILRRFGFRLAMTVNALLAAVTIGAPALFSPGTPVWIMIAVLLVGGLFRSLQFTSVNTIAFAEVEPRRMSRATSLASVSQQLSVSTGVTIGALALEIAMAARGDTALTAATFPPAFATIALISASAAILFAMMPKDAGAEMAQRK
ncbi:DHA2 family efflux MFS transporter permease subunit [Rhodoplanes sp. TEM]|uniref:DHA2 family efflux MFS transporter permease subunit n=1 Tax=Rhodoplanes tepidamans TaxID=200616 RepID=A0ABT5JF96_RHOTP|nr:MULTISPECIES: DHA2 family efflux MFS transporter permease subunit [Rhodoplanes]MDC7788153.1 DHA2 family efflux MFS transporter permease subunit [Rhodoplanes tepidamans]MDC7987255.1 DHA2 family efflux MFS transporter permease subunit [Rhodoplanes sp. TEM]MDQ0355157.1 EmrB/QacA subfamily drug resistance transporter [Rhodoplanes tepidamans]